MNFKTFTVTDNVASLFRTTWKFRRIFDTKLIIEKFIRFKYLSQNSKNYNKKEHKSIVKFVRLSRCFATVIQMMKFKKFILKSILQKHSYNPNHCNLTLFFIGRYINLLNEFNHCSDAMTTNHGCSMMMMNDEWWILIWEKKTRHWIQSKQYWTMIQYDLNQKPKVIFFHIITFHIY